MLGVGGNYRAKIFSCNFTTNPLHSAKETIPENIMLSVLQRTINYTSSAEIIFIFIMLIFVVVIVVVAVHPFFFGFLEAICAIFQPKLCF